MSNKVLLDASAYIAYLNKEPGFEVIEKIINHACMNTITYTEVISFYAKKGLDKKLLKELCHYVEIIDVDENICFNAGYMIKASQQYGLSLGDRLCIASAMAEKCAIYTADKIWLKLEKTLDIKIILIR